jgi:hypothetical protein
MNRKCCVRTQTQVLAAPQPVQDGSTTRRLRRSNTSAAFGSAGSWSTTSLPGGGDIRIIFPGRRKELATRRSAETRDANGLQRRRTRTRAPAAHALDRRRRALTCSPLLEIGWRSRAPHRSARVSTPRIRYRQTAVRVRCPILNGQPAPTASAAQRATRSRCCLCRSWTDVCGSCAGSARTVGASGIGARRTRRLTKAPSAEEADYSGEDRRGASGSDDSPVIDRLMRAGRCTVSPGRHHPSVATKRSASPDQMTARTQTSASRPAATRKANPHQNAMATNQPARPLRMRAFSATGSHTAPDGGWSWCGWPTRMRTPPPHGCGGGLVQGSVG